jgi:hypothetical protein
MNVGIGNKQRSFISGYICLEYSVQCIPCVNSYRNSFHVLERTSGGGGICLDMVFVQVMPE